MVYVLLFIIIMMYVYFIFYEHKPGIKFNMLKTYNNSPLRSSNSSPLIIHRIRTKHEEAAFSFYAPLIWNKLSDHCKALMCLKPRLKAAFVSDKCHMCYFIPLYCCFHGLCKMCCVCLMVNCCFYFL